MTGRRIRSYAVMLSVVSLFAAPAAAQAGSGGTGLSPGPGSSNGSPSTTSPGAGVTAGNVPVTASGNGLTLTTTASALLNNRLTFSGTAPAGAAGQTIQIQRLGHQTSWQWAQTVSTTVGSDGSFSVSWHTNHIGRFSVRAVLGGVDASSAASDPLVVTTVYRVAIATLYGPGFYGQRTACGKKLTRTMIGVANRTLKCGSKVAVDYQGKTMIIPVIDRGPYANNADWDLTMATGKALGITSTVKLGAVSLPPQPARAGSTS